MLTRPPRLFPSLSLAVHLACATAVAAPLGLVGVPAQAAEPAAQAEVRQYSIPAGPLDQVLNRFIRESGIYLAGTVDMVRGKRSAGLRGEYSAEQALRMLLEGTGIGYRFTDADTVTLTQAGGQSGQGPWRLGSVTVTADQTGYGRVEGYKADIASVGTKTSVPIAVTPVSVQTVPRQVIEDQGAQGLEDIYANVSGVVPTGNTLNASSEVLPVIRGFESPVLLRDGMRANTDGAGLGAVDLVNVDSIQVLKGPSSILYGAIEPGGILSFTTKKPQPEPFITAEQELGSFARSRTTLDATGPVNADKSVQYRFAAAYTNADSFRDVMEVERTALAPSLMLELGENTELLLEASYSKEETPYDSGVPVGANGEKLVDNDTFFGQANLEGRELEDTFATARLEHRFDSIFTLRTQLQYHKAEASNEGLRNRGVGGSVGNETLERRYQHQDRVEEQYELVADLIALFETREVMHEVLIGVNFNDLDSDNSRFRETLPVDIPISNNPPQNYTPPASQPREENLFGEQWAALYIQDQMDLLDDRLHLLVGGRYDTFESEQTRDGTASPDVDESAYTGRVGALYDLTDWVSPYVSYAESFNPQGAFAVDAGGDILPPEEGVQYEAGMKFNFFDDRLAATLAAFHIEKENVAGFDSSVGAFNTSDQRSRGVELDVSGRLGEGLDVIANYAYTDTELLDNPADPSLEGEELGNVPEHSARIFLKYALPPHIIEGASVFGGVRYEDTRRAQFDIIELDDFVTVDVGGRYETTAFGGRGLSFQINVYNLFDEDYFDRASDQSIVHPGAPRHVMGTVRLKF